MAKKTEEDKRKEQDDKIIKQNGKLLNKIVKMKPNRNVKEQEEPIFTNMLNKFRLNYGKTVVMNSAQEILKYASDEI